MLKVRALDYLRNVSRNRGWLEYCEVNRIKVRIFSRTAYDSLSYLHAQSFRYRQITIAILAFGLSLALFFLLYNERILSFNLIHCTFQSAIVGEALQYRVSNIAHIKKTRKLLE